MHTPPPTPTDFHTPEPGAASAGIVIHGKTIVPGHALRFDFARSSGPGGQNVNKRSTKCQMRVALGAISIHHDAGVRFRSLAGSHITIAQEIMIEADEYRSQGQNKDACRERLRALLMAAMVRPKVRKKTRPSKGSVERRIREKKQRSQTKRHRTDGGE